MPKEFGPRLASRYGSWPDSGETDIMEHVGEKDESPYGPGYSARKH